MCADRKEALTLSKLLVQQKLVACANYFPVESVYRWNGEIQTEGEYALIAKSLEKQWDQIIKVITEQHSYECPCIIKYKVDANKAYIEWVKESIDGTTKS